MTTQSPQAVFHEALALQEKGDYQGALERYSWLLSKAPRDPQLLNLCACANSELGRYKPALALLKRAVKEKPDFADAWNNLGMLRQHRGNLKGALEAYQKVRELSPTTPVAHANAANVHLLLEDNARAREAYEQALRQAPEDSDILSALAKALLGLGEWGEALDVLDRVLARKPGYTGALALRSVALGELKREEEWHHLNDFDRLIEPSFIEVPAGYDSLEEFNRTLAEHCLNHPTLEYERAANATRKGHHSGNFASDADPGPIAHLLEIITAKAQAYSSARPGDGSHPFLAQRPEKWTYDIWGVVLGDLGYQEPHVHPDGWLSGVYYVSLPDVVTAGDGEESQGWIEFGRPIAYPEAKAEPVIRLVRPEEGKMVLFPSYFYHRTVPFHAKQKRISIAFDLIPAD